MTIFSRPKIKIFRAQYIITFNFEAKISWAVLVFQYHILVQQNTVF